MKPLTGLIAFLLVSLVVLVVIFGQGFFDTAQNQARLFLANLTGTSPSHKCESLAKENERLRFELSKYKSEAKRKSEEGKIADVFSRYPFNNKERLVINMGKKEGVRVGNPVLTASGYLLGKIGAVQNHRSEVKTIFDPEWKSSVALGDPKTKAAMKGGQPPKLELIPKKAEVKEGDFIFNISPDFPYEKLIGKSKEIKENPKRTWYTTSVATPYSIDEITEIIILTGFNKN